jgi:periplasmic copper chaperone A
LWFRGKPFPDRRRITIKHVGSACGHPVAAATSSKNREIMLQNSSLRRRILSRVGVGIGAAVAAMLALPAVASAHVTVQPGTVEGGGFSVVSFRVPNERDDASTTQLRVTLPEDQPIGSVQTTAVPGWKITTATRQLDKPIEMFGEPLDTVVSEVTWTATNGGIRPGQFQDFNLSLGQLPESGELVFNTLQTYSSGEKVNWNEVSADPAVEPDHPAPILSITPAAADGNSGATDNGSQAGQDEQISTAAESDNGSLVTLALMFSGAALVLSLVAALLAWRRGQQPASVAEAAPERTSEDVNV